MPHERTQPQPPDAWLVVHRLPGFPERVQGIDSSPNGIRIELSREIWGNNPDLVILKDDPSLPVVFSGIPIENAACLSARDNWFLRHESLLEPYLTNPKRAQVFTFEEGILNDPLQSHKSTAEGPFPWSKGIPLPECGECKIRLSFIGVLDFRQSRRFLPVEVPNGSLVFHGCQKCGPGPGTCSLQWITEKDDITIIGEEAGTVEVGTAWEATDYPTPFLAPHDIDATGAFAEEGSVFTTFCCFADKVGGHIFWIQGEQGDEEFVFDSERNPMTFIGQFTGSKDVELGDGGLAYIFYSEKTKETRLDVQGF